ncbi:putative signal transduction protein with Nacht domain [Calothrix sp. NIES-4071]|nr:putative signal transduction protein with Nacht domain [Calothrix sp. NIES-4071]BAZ54383.1 putative signal transduction protein with Nacht domain [Calothrix sp. NIES-4105]
MAGIVVKFAWDGGSNLNLGKNIQQMIFSASKKYVENYAERHGKLKVLGMREPVKLEDVYTAVQFLGEEGIKAFASIDNLEEAFRKSQTRGFQSKCEKQDGLKVANSKQYLMVLGQPGAGKSTFLRRLGLEALKGKEGGYKHECVPVFLELKRFTKSEINLEKAIIQELENCGFPKPDDSAKKLLEKGKLLILLDGLDEIPTQQLDKAITTIQDFVDKHSQNRFIASCRTAAYRSGFQRFNDVVMADFDDEQIEQFINNWFQSEQDKHVDTAKRCWELLQQQEYDATKELAQTPLLLTLLCLVFDDSQTFPKNRAVLYGEALDVLLKKWASEKRVQRDPIYKDLSLKLEEMMLAEIASHNFVENKLFFSQREVEAQISKFLVDNLNAPKHLDASVILEAIQIQQGILVERAKDVLSFSHLTLQEYLTAQYIVDNNGIEELVKHELANTRWREVFLLVAGLMRGGTDQLLLLMEKEALSYINTPKLQALLRWAHEQTADSVGDIKPVDKRAFAIAHAHANVITNVHVNVRANPIINAFINTITDTQVNTITNAQVNTNVRAIANARAYGKPIPITTITYTETKAQVITITYSKAEVISIEIRCLDADAIIKLINYVHNLENLKIFNQIDFTALIAQIKELRAKIPAEFELLEVHKSEAKHLMEIWFHAFNLTPEMVNLSGKEMEALDNYLYANHLIIECKDAAVRLAPKTWEGIEQRMFKIN